MTSFGQIFAIRQSCLIALAASVGAGTLTWFSTAFSSSTGYFSILLSPR
ncbi:hypothetical protein [Paracoccus tibetensis]|nr:hypothetical protein [Paracoccus tibetensis]